MSGYIINGGKALNGIVDISGAKNALLPILAASVLTDGECVFENCPNISDIDVGLSIIKELCCQTSFDDGVITINTSKIGCNKISRSLTEKMRGSIIFMGALLGRFGEAFVSKPGGCAIGERPIDLHIEAMKKLGAVFDGDKLICPNGLKGADICLKYPSVGATENIILAAALSKGVTKIINPAKEPEITDLCCFLNSAGANIYFEESGSIVIEGVKKLRGTRYRIMSDRIEAATFMTAAAITKGRILLRGFDTRGDYSISAASSNTNTSSISAVSSVSSISSISAVLKELRKAGCIIQMSKEGIIVEGGAISSVPKIVTGPFPAFPTDVQPQFMSLLTLARGTSIIVETVFERRFAHAQELNKMGADIELDGRNAIIRGVERLTGADVSAADLRGGAALILAGLAANGRSVVKGREYVERGYDAIERKLSLLGADIGVC